HRVLAAPAHEQPHRCKEATEEHAEEKTRIHPPQDFSHSHPEAIDVGKTPGPSQCQDYQEAAQDEASQTRGLPMPHHWPYANQGEDAPHNKTKRPVSTQYGESVEPS